MEQDDPKMSQPWHSGLFLCPHNEDEGRTDMFEDDFIQELMLDKEFAKIPKDNQKQIIHVFENVLEARLKGDKDARLSELFMGL